MHLMRRGFPLPEVDNWDTGMLMNYVFEYDAMVKRQNGEVVHDNLARYRAMKEMEPEMDARYASGEIKEHKYREYKEALRRCEMALEVTE